MKLSKLILCFLFGSMLLSCEKNVLDKNPLGEIDESLVWSDLNLAKLYVNNIYAEIPGSVQRGLDNATELGEQGHNWMDCQNWNTGDITPNSAPFQDEWNLCYTQIRAANTFLKNYTTIKGNANAINVLKGEVLFLRAYYYSELANLFGGVPLISKPQQLTDDLFVPRASYDETVAFIAKDLDDAAAALPGNREGGELGKATKGAALALKSRMLLSAASALHNQSNSLPKWQAAANAAKVVIDLVTYSLYPNYYDLFHVDNNEEVIFDKQYAFPIRTQGAEYWMNPQGFQGAFGATRPTQEMVDYYEMSNGRAITEAGSGYDPANPYTNRDPRFYMSILYNGAPWRGGVVETFTDGANGPGAFDQYNTGTTMTGYYTRKFISEKNPVAGVDKSNENYILIRYAEVLLNYAESQIALGNYDEARRYINFVRDRSGMPPVPPTLTGTALQQRYMNERTVELALEEIHFFDIRRWKTAPQLLGNPVNKMTITKVGSGQFTYEVKVMESRAWRSALYFVPIPQSEINKNPKLQQNPGY